MSPRASARGRRDELHGVLVVDKPRGLTSAAVVAQVRRRTRVATAGHTGTLDPLATGVLPVCLGAATKLVQWLAAEDKAYDASLELGVETDTLDLDGLVVRRDPEGAARVDAGALAAAVAAVAARREQVPPMFSAIKQGGVRLHELARAGVEVERAPRTVEILEARLLEVALPRARLHLRASKGTYVRSFVRDVGAELGCGATLTALRRTASGRFAEAQAVPLAEVAPEVAAARLVTPARALALPAVTVVAAHWRDVLDGRPLPAALVADVAPGLFQLLTPAGDVLAICERAAGAAGAGGEGGAVVYHRVLAYGAPDVQRSR